MQSFVQSEVADGVIAVPEAAIHLTNRLDQSIRGYGAASDAAAVVGLTPKERFRHIEASLSCLPPMRSPTCS